MPIWNLTEEKVEELKRLLREKEMNYEALLQMSIYQIWKSDLDNFLKVLKEYEDEEEADRAAMGGVKNNGAKKKKARGPTQKSKKEGSTMKEPKEQGNKQKK